MAARNRRVWPSAAFLLAALFPFAAMAGIWQLDPESSVLGFRVTQMGAEFEGHFRRFDADIQFSPDDLAASRVKIVIDISSADTRNEDRDHRIVSADWFDAASFPEATFETTSIEDLGGGLYKANAKLTMRGVSQQVVLPFALAVGARSSGAGGWTANVTGELTVDRTKWGIGRNQWMSDAVIGHDVVIFLNIQAYGAD